MAVTPAIPPSFSFPHEVPLESIDELLKQGLLNPMEALLLYIQTMGPTAYPDIFNSAAERDTFFRDRLEEFSSPGMLDKLDEGAFGVRSADQLLDIMTNANLPPIEGAAGATFNPITMEPVGQTAGQTAGQIADYVPVAATADEVAAARIRQEAEDPAGVFARFLGEQMPGFERAPTALRYRARLPYDSLRAQFQAARPFTFAGDEGVGSALGENAFYNFLTSRLRPDSEQPAGSFAFQTAPMLTDAEMRDRRRLIAEVLGGVGDAPVEGLTEEQANLIRDLYTDTTARGRQELFDLSLLRGTDTPRRLGGFPAQMAWRGAQTRLPQLQRRFELEKIFNPIQLGSFLGFLNQQSGDRMGQAGLQELLGKAHTVFQTEDLPWDEQKIAMAGIDITPETAVRVATELESPESQLQAVLASQMAGLPTGMQGAGARALGSLFDRFRTSEPERSFLDVAKQYGLF